MRLLFGRHARERQIERGFSVNEIKEAIQRGSKYLQKPNKIVSEYKYFRVVYKKIKDGYYIITIELRW